MVFEKAGAKLVFIYNKAIENIQKETSRLPLVARCDRGREVARCDRGRDIRTPGMVPGVLIYTYIY